MPVMPGAEAFAHDGGPTGVLLCHGFTGSPQSLRPWAEYLAAAGLSVSLPRLPGSRHHLAGDGQDALGRLVRRGRPGLRRAAGSVRGDLPDGPVHGRLPGAAAGRAPRPGGSRARAGQSVGHGRQQAAVRSHPGCSSTWFPRSRASPATSRTRTASEAGYDRTPVKAAATLPGLWKTTQQHLAELTQPVLVFHSTTDHVVGPASLKLLRQALPPNQLEVRELADSYHVATLDMMPRQYLREAWSSCVCIARRGGNQQASRQQTSRRGMTADERTWRHRRRGQRRRGRVA